MRLPTPPEPAMVYIDATGESSRAYNETQLIEYGRQCALAMREACAEAATDNVAFNGGGVQMEAHVRQSIMGLEIEE